MTGPSYALLHRDPFLVVVDKASGLLSVPGIGPEKADCLVSRMQRAHPGARIVHRLDRDTSGVIALALDAETHRLLSMAFEARLVEKTYEALVAGHLAQDRGVVDLPLRKEALGSARQIVHPTEGKPSLTHFEVLARGVDEARPAAPPDGDPRWTRVRLEPKTGRSHQLRVHMLSLGHPILGDELYGTENSFRVRPRLCLHARTLAFEHPRTGERVAFEAPCPF